MRKTLTVFAVVVLVAALFAMPGLAAARGGNGGGNGGGNSGGSHRGGNGGTWFNLYSTIKTIDAGARSITVEIVSPLNLLKHNPLTVETTADTRFLQCDGEVSVRISFTDLEEGWDVRIKGTVDDGVFVATKVIQYVQ
ncbi:MAG: DUF5666 domain-containing protein [Anaerolineae bacterium]